VDDRAFERQVGVIADLCRQGLDPDALRAEVLPRLRRVVPVDALWWALTDPGTLLFTRTYREEIPERTGRYFVENEFLADDVNKWVDVSADPGGVRTLAQATDGRLAESARFRDVFQPLGLGDELRAALRANGEAWGFMCLHREEGIPFSAREARFVRRIATHLGDGIRIGMLLGGLDHVAAADAPGVVLLRDDGSPLSMTPAAEAWLAELGHPQAADTPLPTEILALAALARDPSSDGRSAPRLRLRTRAARWAVLCASRLPAAGEATTAIVIDEASPAEVAPVIMLAYGLTEREREVTGLVCRGASTAQVAADLHISPYTVQDHLKAVFEKVGVRSRRELVATILREHYLPNAEAGRPLGPSGYFA
jgi:DNA-binding CsgD family transcriptional regulator